MTCEHCDAGRPRVYGEHYGVSERGTVVVGTCTAPDVSAPQGAAFPFAERLAAWRDRIRAMGKRVDEPQKAPPPSWLEIAANRQEEDVDGEP
jgi:hypothetical protein